MALAGAQLLLYPTAIGWDPNDTPDEQARQLDAWITIQRSHAIANGLTVWPPATASASSRTRAADLRARFWGSSFVCGPQGEILAQRRRSVAQAAGRRGRSDAHRTGAAASGPFCATGASMPMMIWSGASAIEH
jgi:predicted amidohydrolase